MSKPLTRRAFCAAATAATVSPRLLSAGEGPSFKGRIYKAVKVSMVEGSSSLLDTFKMSRDAGFEGISLFAPDRFDLTKARRAAEKTGVMVHNVNNAVHWQTRLSDPDPEVRKKALAAMEGAIQFAHDAGGSSILQVVGKVTDPKKENHRQVWDRSIEQIRKALPLASRLGVRILCENVRNGFCKRAERWRAYLDTIGDPWVGAFYDIGNHQSFGGSPHWVRTLGDRIVKLDVKGHKEEADENCDIFQGDVDWAGVRRELASLRFTGWATAEVSGGGPKRLEEVSRRMSRALGL